MRRILGISVLLLALATTSDAGFVSLPYTFTPNTTARSAEVMANYTAITDVVNGNIENVNISATAAIAESKLAFSTSGHTHVGAAQGGPIGLMKGADIASGATLTIGTDGNYFVVTGTTTVTALSTRPLGTIAILRFSGQLILTHNATSLILKYGQNALTDVGDTYTFMSEGSGNWREISRSVVGGDAVPGAMRDHGAVTAPTGWLFADGTAVSRTTYAALFAAVTFTTTGDTTNASAAITNIPSTSNIRVGMPIEGANIPASTTIASITSATAITISQNATGTTAGGAIRVLPYGQGDGSTTFNTPDTRGRVTAGYDNMGGSAANRLNVALTGNTTNASASVTNISSTATLTVGMKVIGAGIPLNATITTINSATAITLSANATATAVDVPLRFGVVDGATAGGAGGSQIHTLSTAQMPAHTHPGVVNNTDNGRNLPVGTGFNDSGSSGSAGGGQAHPTVQPTLMVAKVIKY